MRTVCERLGWELGTLEEFDREWVMYSIIRAQWETGRRETTDEGTR